MSNNQKTSIRPEGWPQERPVAIAVSVMLEGWTDDSAPGIGPMGNPLRAGVFDTQARSWADYGPRTGAWHLLDALADLDCKAVFYVSGILAARYPEVLRAIVAEGHEIAAHSWAQNIIPAYQTREEELFDLKRCIAELETHSGMRPRGWISPRATPSLNTPELLAEEGMLWYADVFDQDLPYTVPTAKGGIVGMPFAMEVNDFPLSIRYGNEPDAFNRMLGHLLNGWHELKRPEACLDIAVHAHVFGRPAGIIAFKNALRLAKECDFAWLTNHARVAELFDPSGVRADGGAAS